MATITEPCPKCRKGKAHSGRTWKKRTRYTLFGKVTDTYKCKGVRRVF